MRLLVVLMLASFAHGQMKMTSTFWGTLPIATTPTDSPGAGTYSSTQAVTLSDTLASSSICYTTDGTTPTTTAPGTCGGGTTSTYTVPFNVAATSTVKFLATKTGFANSALVSSTYTITTMGLGNNLGAACIPGVTAAPSCTLSTTSGRKIVACIQLAGNASIAFSSSSQGLTYSDVFSGTFTDGGGFTSRCLMATAGSTANETLTFSLGGATRTVIWMFDMIQAITKDKTAGPVSAASNQDSGATATLTTSPEFILCAAGEGFATANSWTAAGWTSIGQANISGTTGSIGLFYKVAGSTAAQDCAVTASVGGNFGWAGVATFQ